MGEVKKLFANGIVLVNVINQHTCTSCVRQHLRPPQESPESFFYHARVMALRTRTPGAGALLPVTRCQSSGPLGALLIPGPGCAVNDSALQVLQIRRLRATTRSQSSGQLGALLSSPVLGVRLMTALQVLQVRAAQLCPPIPPLGCLFISFLLPFLPAGVGRAGGRRVRLYPCFLSVFLYSTLSFPL